MGVEYRMKPLLTVRHIAEILSVKERTVRDWLMSGELKGYKIGKSWRVREEDLEAFLGSRSNRDPTTDME